MFDDWAYRDVLQVVPEQKAVEAPTRARSKSIVQRVAIHSEITEVDPEIARPRRNSLPKVAYPDKSSFAYEFPWSKSEKNRLWDPSKYSLGMESDDKTFIEALTLLTKTELAAGFCSSIKQEARDFIAKIDLLDDQFASAISQLETLQLVAKDGHETQQKLDSLYSELSAALEVYGTLEAATRTLNRPGRKVVSKAEEFRKLIEDLKKGLEFCKAHPDFKDMDLYELRFNQCISRAVSMAQDYVTQSWRSLQQSTQKKLDSATPALRNALLWPKFQSDTENLIPIVQAVSELDSLDAINELRRSFFSTRAQLLRPLLIQMGTQDLKTIIPAAQDLYEKEKTLYLSYFKNDENLSQYLSDLSEPLYIELRAKIIRETDFETLCNVIMALQEENLDLAVFSEIYKDTQARLSFRAESYIDKALSSKPTIKDFRADQFPAVRNTLNLLKQLYQLMNAQVFNDFAHQCVTQCISVLRAARTEAISSLGPMAGSLFQVKQLLVLQKGLLDFDLSQEMYHEVDFSGLETFVNTVSQNPRNFLSISDLMEAAKTSVPQVVDKMYDGMQEVLTELQSSVRLFTSACVDLLMEPLAKNDPRSAKEDTRKLRECIPTALDRISKLVRQHIEEPKVVDALLDSIHDAFLAEYADYYTTIYNAGSPDQLDGVMDPDGLTSWLGSNGPK